MEKLSVMVDLASQIGIFLLSTFKNTMGLGELVRRKIYATETAFANQAA